MLQVKLAILFNDNFCMEHLHNPKSVTGILGFDKRPPAQTSGGALDDSLSDITHFFR
jgi:hypothetical protein